MKKGRGGRDEHKDIDFSSGQRSQLVLPGECPGSVQREKIKETPNSVNRVIDRMIELFSL